MTTFNFLHPASLLRAAIIFGALTAGQPVSVAQGTVSYPTASVTVAKGTLLSCGSSVSAWNTWLADGATIDTFSVCLELDSIVPVGSSSYVLEGSCNSTSTSLANVSADFSGSGKWTHGQTGTVLVVSDDCFYTTGSYSLRIVVGVPDLNGTVIQAFIPVAVGALPPTISSVVNGASFQAGITPDSWVTITGTNLSLGSLTNTWANSIVNGTLPTTLDGVSTSIGGKPSYVYFISPSQINIQAPDVGLGAAPVTVTTPFGSATVNTTTAIQAAPAFFLWANKYAVATRQDYSLAVKNGTFAGTTTVPAKPGDVLILWGTSFGPTNPPIAAGIEVPADRVYATATPVTVTINGISAQVYGAALSPGFAGLYQIAIQVPTSLGNGDWAIQATVAGFQSSSTALITVQP